MSERLSGSEPYRQPQSGDIYPDLPESATIGLRQLARQELSRIVWSSIDTLSVEIALKGLAKLDLKDELDQMQAFRDDVTVHQRMKHLGSLVIVEAVSRFEYTDDSVGLNIHKGDYYIDFHIPPLSTKEKEFPSISKSFEMVADHIVKHDIPGEYLIGITYEKLARASRRFGFTAVDIDLSPELIRGVENVFRNFREKYGQDDDMGKIQLCFQKRQDFLDRFISKSK